MGTLGNLSSFKLHRLIKSSIQSCRNAHRDHAKFEAAADPITSIDLFSGTGGFSEGAFQAGEL